MLKKRFLSKIYYSGVFGVADHEYAVRLKRLFALRWWIQDGGPIMVPTNAKNAKNDIFT